jgi:hypothetical protein
MKLASGSAQTILESRDPRGVVFVELGFTSGTQRLTTASATIDWNGFAWAGLGGLLAIDPLREAESTEIIGGKLRVSGVPSSEISKALTEDVRGKPITIYFGVMSEALAIVDAPVEFFGFMNRYTFRRGNPTAELELSFESELASARRPRVRRYTQEDQQRDYPDDTYFAHINKIAEMNIKIGRWVSGRGR